MKNYQKCLAVLCMPCLALFLASCSQEVFGEEVCEHLAKKVLRYNNEYIARKKNEDTRLVLIAQNQRNYFLNLAILNNCGRKLFTTEDTINDFYVLE